VAQRPDGLAAIDHRGLIDLGPGVEGGLGLDRVQHGGGGDGVEADAAQVGQHVHADVAHGAQFAGVARLAQDAGRGEAAPVGEGGEGHLHQRQAVEMGQQVARILARLDADGGGVGVFAKSGKSDGGGGGRLIAEQELGISHRSPP
jgi:hypothetical protein